MSASSNQSAFSQVSASQNLRDAVARALQIVRSRAAAGHGSPVTTQQQCGGIRLVASTAMPHLKPMRDRTFEFSSAVIAEFRRLKPADEAEQILWQELLKTQKALATNTAESDGAHSRKDFALKFQIALKEGARVLPAPPPARPHLPQPADAARGPAEGVRRDHRDSRHQPEDRQAQRRQRPPAGHAVSARRPLVPFCISTFSCSSFRSAFTVLRSTFHSTLTVQRSTFRSSFFVLSSSFVKGASAVRPAPPRSRL